MNRRELLLTGVALAAVSPETTGSQATTPDQKPETTAKQMGLPGSKQNQVPSSMIEIDALAAAMTADFVQSGDQPFAREEQPWRIILERVAKLYSLPASLQESFAATFLDISQILSTSRRAEAGG